MGSNIECSPSPVLLNIGGKKYATTVDTLTQREPYSMLAAMFSGRHNVCRDSETGMVFVDRDGKQFRHILNWLRDGILPTLTNVEYQELLREAEYYQLLDLTFVDLSFACIRKTTFSRANLHKAKLGDVEGEGSIFQDAILRECEFIGANLTGAVLDGANLQSANLQDACLVGCSFSESDLRSAHLQNANLSDANLKGANLEGANLKGAKLSGANLQSANLQRAYLRDVDLRDTHMDGAKLGGANLLGTIR
ncbi:FH protein interacting protein FIP2 isoform X3 [Dendrobium catenatum]|uniref:FH protein interacting protein FIP2 isoform X3 n=1 Tax=Dendrobium catenatum TaxID=906689 RepID=UPI0009F37A5A|nr:FH protein interacting protein FIP2 isoform X3 [Dendrobium catenatum]